VEIKISNHDYNEMKMLENSSEDIRLNTSEVETVSSGLPYDREVIAENLFVPWALAISDDGKIFFTERSGVIRVIENGKLLSQPLISFQSPFVTQEESGLLGIALDPDYITNHYIYVMYTYIENNRLFNRVVRLLEQDNKGVEDRILIDKIPGSSVHNGGRIKVGPDRKLYVGTGDAGNSSLAQNLTSTAGKILRINLDGTIPEDNPFPDSPVYSYGFRNPQGLTWGTNNMLYSSEHGQSAYDEINIIEPGKNYGWPLVKGDDSFRDVSIQKPLVHSANDTWAPSGIAYIDQGPLKGRLLAASLRGKQLLSFQLNEDGTQVMNIEPYLTKEYGRLREVVLDKDGSIYITTSNMDGRAIPGEFDDRIIRLTPNPT
jgi:glucose/arabinose dehydrogenase